MRRYQFSNVQSIQVKRLVGELVCNFFAFDYQKALVSAMQGVQAVNACQKIMVGQNEEVISMLAIPADNIFGRRIAIAVEGMGVRIASIPARG